MTKKIKPQTLKGFRDFLPEEMAIRQKVIDALRKVFESYGFEPLETPALEYSETLLGKYGSEADKLIYQFKDRGGREVGLRFDLTVPLVRVIAANPTLPMPFKRYQVQSVWRAEKPQAGRFREFLQCDIDTVGSSNLRVDAEIIACLLACMESLGVKEYKLYVNDLKYLDEFLKKYGMEKISIYRALDKQLPESFKDDFPGREIVKIFRSRKDPSVEKSKKIAKEFMRLKEPESIIEIKRLVKEMNDGANRIEYSRGLARGLEYYTGIVFELVLKGYENLSVGGGGRYDNLIGMFLGRDIPAVGFSFGLDRLIEATKQQGLFKKLPKTTTKVLVTIFSPGYQKNSIEMVQKLRNSGINTELYLNPEAKLDKQLKHADRKGIPYAVIIGPEETKKGVVTLKDMKKKVQEEVAPNQLPKKLGS